jgi:hypothetical protein
MLLGREEWARDPLRTALALATAAVASVSLAAVPAHTATAQYLDESVAIADGYVTTARSTRRIPRLSSAKTGSTGSASSSGWSGSFRTPTGS